MSHTPNKGSLNAKLAPLAVGERVFIECEQDGLVNIQRQVSSATRRPSCMDGMDFKSNIYTAVATQKVGVIVYLVCVERVQ